MNHFRTVILGAGAAGLHCASYAAKTGSTLLIDHAKSPGEKIRISGGGRCNFTNIHTSADNFLSRNPHFAKSALARFGASEFVELVKKHRIAFHEKTLGQLFCDHSAKDIINMLLENSRPARLRVNTAATGITKTDSGFSLTLSDGSTIATDNLVVATGGKSIPKMGATGFGYDIARQFGLNVLETSPGLVPLTFGEKDLHVFRSLAGLSLEVQITCNTTTFKEALLFTHRGLSGPAILQISNYWCKKDPILINLLPNQDPFTILRQMRSDNGRRNIATTLADLIPARLAAALAEKWQITGNIADQSDAALQKISTDLKSWTLHPTGSEGYRTAEVTLGGVDTGALNPRTMESKAIPGLYFIGEVVDVTGWLGGYNFQWAWSSAHAAGTAIAAKYD